MNMILKLNNTNHLVASVFVLHRDATCVVGTGRNLLPLVHVAALGDSAAGYERFLPWKRNARAPVVGERRFHWKSVRVGLLSHDLKQSEQQQCATRQQLGQMTSGSSLTVLPGRK